MTSTYTFNNFLKVNRDDHSTQSYKTYFRTVDTNVGLTFVKPK